MREGVADPETITEPFLTADLLRKYAADGGFSFNFPKISFITLFFLETRCFDDYGPLYDHHEYFTLNSLTTTLLSTCPVVLAFLFFCVFSVESFIFQFLQCGKSELLKIQCLTTFACDVPIQVTLVL